MPVLARKLMARRGWNDEHREALTTGADWWHCFDKDANRHGKITKGAHDEISTEGEAIRKECWADLRDELMAIWIQERPFTRPAGWWLYDAPERRQTINGPHPFDNPALAAYNAKQELEHPGYTAWVSQLSSDGTPCIIGGPDFAANPRPEYESERAYLERLDLLTRFERELIAKGEPCPANLPEGESL